MSRVAFAPLSDLSAQPLNRRIINGYEIAVGCIDGQYYAFEDVCPHAGASLAGGNFDSPHVICPRHDWVFDIRDGQCTHLDDYCVATFETHIDDNTLYVDVPDDRARD